MKKSIALIATWIFISKAESQTGDFQLNNLEQHTQVKAYADPSLKGTGFKRFLLGRNYRKEWLDSITVPVLNLQKDFGGLTPEKEGGGKQTHTLHLKDGNGNAWVLRSIQKFPEKVVAPELKGTIAEKLVRDGISASYPYSVLSVGTLAKASGVPYLPNTVVYIPDDPQLGEFRSTYKNTLALFESRTIDNDKEKKTFDTEEIIPGLQKSKERIIDQQAVLRARLLDNFIMDFDRHEGQWFWAEKDSNGRKYFYPIPKDRDQAFFKATGLLPKLLSGSPALGPIQGLRAKPKDILTFNHTERNFDRAFLTELDEQTWSNEIDHFLSSMTDDVIKDALSKQPKEVEKYSANDIADILKKKRTSFKEDMLHYYRFLSKTVSVVGSNDAENFTINKNPDGSLKVEMQDKEGVVIYSRLFDAAVTKEVRVYGLEGNDRFTISGEESPVKIRIIGGPGEDTFTNSSNGKAIVYDVSFEKNTLTGKNFKNKISPDPLNNEYRRIYYDYNSSSPGIFPEYSKDGGLFLGLSYKITTHGFRKAPYASKHFMYVTKALTSSAWHLHYDADFMKIGRNTDLLLRSDAKLPTVRTHFFGYGNNTVFDKNKGADYYKVHYRLFNGSLMFRNFLSPAIQLRYGTVLQHFKLSPAKNESHYVGNIDPSEFSYSFYNNKWYGGGEVSLLVNTKNNEAIPTRGVSSDFYVRHLRGLNQGAFNFSQAGGEFSFYTDFLFKKHIILASSFGLHHNFGKFEIPQAQYLGFKQDLRGYRFQRFAGRTRAYNNTELRVNFGDVNLYLIKGPFGIIGFHDIGRVWIDNDDTDTWHRGYGGGIWLAPFKKVAVSGLLAYSREEKALPMVTFGFQF